MTCQHCGAQVTNSAKRCIQCSKPIASQEERQQIPVHYGKPPGSEEARISRMCAFCGFFVGISLVFGILAIIQGRKAKQLGYTGNEANIGIVVGIIDVVVGSLGLLALVISLIIVFFAG